MSLRVASMTSILLLGPAGWAATLPPPTRLEPGRVVEPSNSVSVGPRCFGEAATIVGSEENDVLTGTPERDVIVGLGGNDRIKGLGGDDLLCGGDGNDKIKGGGGNDQISEGFGNDRLAGGGGADFLIDADSEFEMQDPKGTVVRLSGNDRLKGRAGRDTCVDEFDSPKCEFDIRDATEVLIFGTGGLAPLDPQFGACPWFGYFTGFPRGTKVRVRVSRTVSSDKVQAIQAARRLVKNATLGEITTRFKRTENANPIPNRNTVTSTSHQSPSTQGCPTDNGCLIHGFRRAGVLKNGRAVQPPSQTPAAYSHDLIGHGVVGLCHIEGSRIGDPANSLMSAGTNVFSGDISPVLTEFDILVLERVYGSEVDPGDQRFDFVEAGLIRP